ncbi:hypothetical protein MMYC01_210341 [Madurella mycetomatis]|uniref:Tf2-1-like SH3-like domain-containing protein n=1 Tax=Madurella mycetomatis TaxID=100816 RepID=A0A175VNS2_9PEZI|nr:hypothetical protein MMYC01_210341 [Madurella mycetomatis]
MDFAAARTKRRYNGKYRNIEFERLGPFVIKRRIGPLVYKLDLPDNLAIHPIILVAHLSPTPPGEDPFDRYMLPPSPVEDSQSLSDDPKPGNVYKVEIVIDHQ